ncbi:MAG: spermidine/putrescine transport system ATP-binding protein [Actinomycetota bacterium]|jgi:spermidine/putrescine transport system ATP-binding protein|nr:spermidine/putrescine transport system ATP-binding protein [Actinomycetota bacterium]
MSDVRLEQISKAFKETVAVDNISLLIEEGEFFSLLGPSGCGKTTTLRMIGGFEEPTSGTIYLGGDDVTGLPPYKRDVNTVFQSYALFPHLDVFENVAYGLKRKKVSGAEIKTRVDEMLELVDLPGYSARRTTQLSGGQQQRVALARALVNRPQVLLLDEPLGALDLKLRKQMQLELKRIQKDVGITFIYVTHDQEEAMTMSDRIAVMSAGQMEQVGAPQDVYELPATEFVAGFLGASNLLDGRIESVDGPTAKVKLTSGAVVLLPAKRAPDSKQVRVGVRPEKLSISTNGGPTDGSNSIEATIRMSTYTGVSTSYECVTDDGATVVVYVQNLDASPAPVGAGQRVTLSWSPEHTFAVEPGTLKGAPE